MANRITLLRFFLLFFLVVMAYLTKLPWLQPVDRPPPAPANRFDPADAFEAC